jgi:acyl-CoA thioesterase-1
MRCAVLSVLLLSLVACSPKPNPEPPARNFGSPASNAGAPSNDNKSAGPSKAARPRIVFLGDSLTAGLGLDSDRSFPSLIQKKLNEKRIDLEVVNAGVSGDTSAGGLRRLDWSLDGDVRVLIVALGGNDGLRGLPPTDLKNNLEAILDRAKAAGIPVILAGMEAPPNNGVDYTHAFRAVYADLAKEYKVAFIPFLLQGVAGDASLNQSDGIHPNVRGAEIVADTVWKAIEPLVSKPQAPSPKPS